MKLKNCWIVALVSVVGIFVTNFLIHQVLLKDMYAATPSLWRTVEEMGQFVPVMMLGQVLVGVFFAWIFGHGYQGRGMGEGVRYGLLMGGLAAGAQLIMHGVQPFPTSLTLAWIGTGLVQYALVGAVAAKVAKV